MQWTERHCKWLSADTDGALFCEGSWASLLVVEFLTLSHGAICLSSSCGSIMALSLGIYQVELCSAISDSMSMVLMAALPLSVPQAANSVSPF